MIAYMDVTPLAIGLGRFALAIWLAYAAVWWLIRKA